MTAEAGSLAAHGMILIDKPSGPTSWDIVEGVRRRLAPRRRRRGRNRYRCGHAGTLDPLATGLLILLCGRATRLSQFILGHRKSYTATIRFGATTDTLDAEGVETARTEPAFGDADLADALAGLTGRLSQVPPAYSALKHEGRPLHRIARGDGELPEIPPRDVDVGRFEALGPPTPPRGGLLDLAFRIECSSGTYVRSLARDLAEALGTVGHLRALRRETVGLFDVADATPFDPEASRDDLLALMRPPAEALPDLPLLDLDEEEAAAVRLGRQPSAEWLARLDRLPASGAPRIRLLDPAGSLAAVAEATGLEDGSPDLRLVSVFPATGEESAGCS